MRYRLRTLLIVLACVGPLCLALRTPTPFWSWAMSSVTLLALLVSVLVVIYRRGRTRAFAVGFLLFGVSFLVFILGGDRLGMQTSGDLDHVAEMLYRQIHGDPFFGNRDLFHLETFRQIVRYGSDFLLGLLGGVIAQMLYVAPPEGE